MKAFRSADPELYISGDSSFSAYVEQQQIESSRRTQKILRACRVATLVLPSCLTLGMLWRTQARPAAPEQATRVATTQHDSRNHSTESTSSTSLVLPTTTTSSMLVVVVQPEAARPPTYDSDVAWVDSLKQELSMQKVQILDPPGILEKNQAMLTVDGQCGAVFAFTTSSNDPNNMNLAPAHFGPLKFFIDAETVLDASQAWGELSGTKKALS